jgi:hypothetical protein
LHRALNEGWKPDLERFIVSTNIIRGLTWNRAPGFRTSAAMAGLRLRVSALAFALKAKAELAEYAGKQFIDIYHRFFIH